VQQRHHSLGLDHPSAGTARTAAKRDTGTGETVSLGLAEGGVGRRFTVIPGSPVQRQRADGADRMDPAMPFRPT
jgi:hypothetical protein